MSVKPAHHRYAFKTLNLNVKSNPEMSQQKVVHDVRKASHQAGLIGWNEISPKRYFDAIKQLGPEWNHYMPHDGGLRIPNPISWKKSVWKKEDAGFVKTHNGKAHVSPNRYITWVKLKHRASGKEVVRINTHLVSGGWSKGQRPTTAWRREMWHEHIRKLEHLVHHFEKQGLDVIVGGDFNRDSFHVLGKEVAYDNKLNVGTHGASTYDYLMHTRSPDLHKLGAHVQHGYASDHDAVIGRYSLEGGAKRKPHAAAKPSGTDAPAAPSSANQDAGSALAAAFESFFAQLLQGLGSLFNG